MKRCHRQVHDEYGDSQDHPEGLWARLGRQLSRLIPFRESHEASESVDDALESSKVGVRAVKISLVALMFTALLQAVAVAFSGSVALLADTIHNFGDALTRTLMGSLRHFAEGGKPPLHLRLWSG